MSKLYRAWALTVVAVLLFCCVIAVFRWMGYYDDPDTAPGRVLTHALVFLGGYFVAILGVIFGLKGDGDV